MNEKKRFTQIKRVQWLKVHSENKNELTIQLSRKLNRSAIWAIEYLLTSAAIWAYIKNTSSKERILNLKRNLSQRSLFEKLKLIQHVQTANEHQFIVLGLKPNLARYIEIFIIQLFNHPAFYKNSNIASEDGAAVPYGDEVTETDTGDDSDVIFTDEEAGVVEGNPLSGDEETGNVYDPRPNEAGVESEGWVTGLIAGGLTTAWAAASSLGEPLKEAVAALVDVALDIWNDSITTGSPDASPPVDGEVPMGVDFPGGDIGGDAGIGGIF